MRIYELTSLNEDRAEYIATSMKDKIESAAIKDTGREVDSLEIVNLLKLVDPSPRGENIQFIARMYAANQFKLEDTNILKQDIGIFLKYRNKLAVKDLNQIGSLNQLYDLIEPMANQAEEPAVVSNKQAVKDVKKDAIVVFNTPVLKVVVPQTEEVAQLYGKGTKWCTSATTDCRFEQYSKMGPLYILLIKMGGKDRKFQFHLESSQYMNERDLPLSATEIDQLSKIPEYTTFLNGLIKKSYSKYFT